LRESFLEIVSLKDLDVNFLVGGFLAGPPVVLDAWDEKVDFLRPDILRLFTFTLPPSWTMDSLSSGMRSSSGSSWIAISSLLMDYKIYQQTGCACG
jgi:hypothetical protein